MIEEVFPLADVEVVWTAIAINRFARCSKRFYDYLARFESSQFTTSCLQ